MIVHLLRAWAPASIVLATVSAGCGGLMMTPARPPGDAMSRKDAVETAQRAAHPVEPAAAPASDPDGGAAAVPVAIPKALTESAPVAATTDELVVDRDLVLRCPGLQRVRDRGVDGGNQPLWMAALYAVADCMGDGGALARDDLGVSGDEEHRHFIREILSARGIAPTRVIALRVAAEGAAECQGGSGPAGCPQPVVITIAPNP